MLQPKIIHEFIVALDLADVSFIFQTKTYDSVTDKFMDFSFEKVKTISWQFFLYHTLYFITTHSPDCNNDILIKSADTQCLHALLQESGAGGGEREGF